MTTIGQQLLQPENGWKRVKIITPFVTTSGSWLTTVSRPDNFTDGIIMFTTTVNSTLSFEFTGTKIRLIAERQSAYDTNGEIEIDGIKSNFSCYDASATYTGKVLVFEKTGLDNTKHTVTIRKITNDAKAINIDSIDIASSQVVLKIDEDKYYSLSDKTLIHLPNGTTDTVMNHGIDSGETILLDTPFTKHLYPTTVANKMATVSIGKTNSISVKEPIQPWTPLYTWYETKMISNTAPVPLVASASSVYNNDPRYLEYKAFNGTTSDANDAFIFAKEVLTGWIQLDFGKNTQVDLIRINSLNNSAAITSTPKDMKLQGSLDGNVFDDIYTLPPQTGWGVNEVRSFDTGKKSNYRFYRLVVDSNNGYASYTAIGQIIFGYKREVN